MLTFSLPITHTELLVGPRTSLPLSGHHFKTPYPHTHTHTWMHSCTHARTPLYPPLRNFYSPDLSLQEPCSLEAFLNLATSTSGPLRLLLLLLFFPSSPHTRKNLTACCLCLPSCPPVLLQAQICNASESPESNLVPEHGTDSTNTCQINAQVSNSLPNRQSQTVQQCRLPRLLSPPPLSPSPHSPSV